MTLSIPEVHERMQIARERRGRLETAVTEALPYAGGRILEALENLRRVLDQTPSDELHRQPVHPVAGDQYTRATAIPGLSLAVDAAGCLVLHVAQGGTYTITNLRSLMIDLGVVAEERDRLEAER